jgi:hypothetical protein
MKNEEMNNERKLFGACMKPTYPNMYSKCAFQRTIMFANSPVITRIGESGTIKSGAICATSKRMNVRRQQPIRSVCGWIGKRGRRGEGEEEREKRRGRRGEGEEEREMEGLDVDRVCAVLVQHAQKQLNMLFNTNMLYNTNDPTTATAHVSSY